MSDFASLVYKSLMEDRFVGLTMSKLESIDADLKKIFGRMISVKNVKKLSIIYRYKTRDIVKNYSFDDVADLANEFLAKGAYATLQTLDFDLICESGKPPRQTKPSQRMKPSDSHDHVKTRAITAEGKTYLHALKITDDKGDVLKSSQDKFRQINRYVELLAPLLKAIPPGRLTQIIDMGSGKGYLTFALYDYLTNTLGVSANVTGVELRPDLVTLCNDIAKASNFNNLGFVQSSIIDFDTSLASVLIALHACDTATDDALFKGIEAGAGLIVVAPCCHKQIRREIESSGGPQELNIFLRHGIFMERQSEMATDGLRALLLEYAGYDVKIFEFISGEHTAKNVMITALKNKGGKNPHALEKFHVAKKFFCIGRHHLETLLEL